MKENYDLTLRPLTNRDLPKMEEWLNKARVKRWYDNPESWLNEIRERFGKFSFLRHSIVCAGGIPIGFCQYYPYEKSGEDWHGSVPLAGTYSIDYMLGEDEYVGIGLGTRMISLLTEKVFRETDALRIIVQPDEANAASCKTLLSCGYRYDPENALYLLLRPQN